MATMIAPRPMPPKVTKEPKKYPGLKRTPLKRTSDKMWRKLVSYREAKAKWWQARMILDWGRCQFVNGEHRCSRQASSSPHHIFGRGKFLCETGTFLACCQFHHRWIEDNKTQARAMGLIRYK